MFSLKVRTMSFKHKKEVREKISRSQKEYWNRELERLRQLKDALSYLSYSELVEHFLDVVSINYDIVERKRVFIGTIYESLKKAGVPEELLYARGENMEEDEASSFEEEVLSIQD